MPEDEAEEIYAVFAQYGISREAAGPVLAELQQKPKEYVDFMMRFELGLEAPAAGRAWRSAVTIAGSYVVGGAVPLAPYMLMTSHPLVALHVSVWVTLVALAVFGALKGKALRTGRGEELSADGGDWRGGGCGRVWVGENAVAIGHVNSIDLRNGPVFP